MREAAPAVPEQAIRDPPASPEVRVTLGPPAASAAVGRCRTSWDSRPVVPRVSGLQIPILVHFSNPIDDPPRPAMKKGRGLGEGSAERSRRPGLEQGPEGKLAAGRVIGADFAHPRDAGRRRAFRCCASSARLAGRGFAVARREGVWGYVGRPPAAGGAGLKAPTGRTGRCSLPSRTTASGSFARFLLSRPVRVFRATSAVRRRRAVPV